MRAESTALIKWMPCRNVPTIASSRVDNEMSSSTIRLRALRMFPTVETTNRRLFDLLPQIGPFQFHHVLFSLFRYLCGTNVS